MSGRGGKYEDYEDDYTIPPKKLLKGTEITDFFRMERSKESLIDASKEVILEMTLEQIYRRFYERNFIFGLSLAGRIGQPVLLLTDWKVLQCLTLDVEATTLQFPAMLQHLDVTFYSGINVDNLKAIDMLKKLSFLKICSKPSNKDDDFGLDLTPLGCRVRNVLESLVLTNISRVYFRPEDLSRLVRVNASITNLSITMEESSECFDLFTEDFTSNLANQINLEYLYIRGFKMFTYESFGPNSYSFVNLLHLYIDKSDYMEDDTFKCLMNTTPNLHYASIKDTKVNLESLGMFMAMHQNLQRVCLFVKDCQTAFPDNLRFKPDVLRYILCFKSWHVENICLCQHFTDEYVETFREDLAGCFDKQKPFNDSISAIKDPLSCSIEDLKELVISYVYKDGCRPCDEDNKCVGSDCAVYFSENMLCSCRPVERKYRH